MALLTLKNVNFSHSFPLISYPFDWRTPGGYIVSLTIVTVKFYYMGTIYLCVLCIMAGIGEFLIAFATDFTHNLNVVNEEIVRYSKLQEPTMDVAALKLKYLFKKTIDFHCGLRQLSDRPISNDKVPFFCNFPLTKICSFCGFVCYGE